MYSSVWLGPAVTWRALVLTGCDASVTCFAVCGRHNAAVEGHTDGIYEVFVLGNAG
jgi:hypothetical protein